MPGLSCRMDLCVDTSTKQVETGANRLLDEPSNEAVPSRIQHSGLLVGAEDAILVETETTGVRRQKTGRIVLAAETHASGTGRLTDSYPTKFPRPICTKPRGANSKTLNGLTPKLVCFAA